LFFYHPQLPRRSAHKRGEGGEVKLGGSKMKYAIVESGGKQYKAVEGKTIEVDRLSLLPGEKVELNDVLLISDEGKVTVGTPTIKGVKVSATVVEEFKGPKVIIFKYHPRKRYRLKKGHRQWYTRIKIEAIAGGQVTRAKKADSKKKEAEKDKPKADVAKKPTAKTSEAKKTEEKKTAAKTETKKSTAKKTTAPKPAAKKPAAKKATPKKSTSKKTTPKEE
jgi:large subunit ribosomal protein L21